MESMEEDVGIVLEEGVVINRHSMRRILRGPVDVEILVIHTNRMSLVSRLLRALGLNGVFSGSRHFSIHNTATACPQQTACTSTSARVYTSPASLHV